MPLEGAKVPHRRLQLQAEGIAEREHVGQVVQGPKVERCHLRGKVRAPQNGEIDLLEDFGIDYRLSLLLPRRKPSDCNFPISPRIEVDMARGQE
jgi:hypothetical protein